MQHNRSTTISDRFRRGERFCQALPSIGSAVVFVVLAGAVPQRTLVADEPATAAFLSGLRQRQLFSTAESYLEERLAIPQLPPDDRIFLTTELSRTIVEQAALLDIEPQAAAWGRARKLVDDLAAELKSNPLSLLLRVESALIDLSAAETVRWRAELSPHRSDWVTDALSRLDASADAYKKLEQQVRSQISTNLKSPGKGPVDGLKLYQLRALELQLQYRHCQALVAAAQMRPVTDRNRAANLLTATPILQTLGKSLDFEDVTWGSRVLLVQAIRLQGDVPAAEKLAGQLEAQRPPGEYGPMLLAERVRCMISRGDLEAADRVTRDMNQLNKPGSGEIAVVRAQLLADRHRKSASAADASAANPSTTASLAALDKWCSAVDQRIGGYWSQRCRVIADQAARDAEFGGTAAPLVRQAEQAFERGDVDSAIAAYEKAAAALPPKSAMAARVRSAQASVELKMSRWEGAAQHFGDASELESDAARSSQWHLLRCFALGKWYEEHASKSRREAYESALTDHRQKFVGQSTEFEACWMLGQHEERRGQLTSAIAAYRRVPKSHVRGPAAALAVVRCYDLGLTRLRERRQSASAWEAEAISSLHSALGDGPQADDSRKWPAWQAEVAVAIARIQITRREPDFAAADLWLAKVQAWAESQPESEKVVRKELQSKAWQLRVVSLAARGEFLQARGLLERLEEASVRDWLQIAAGLSSAAVGLPPAVARELSELELSALERAVEHRYELSVGEQRHLDLCLAAAYAATDSSAKALAVYESLMTSEPENLDLVRKATKLLDQKPDAAGAQTTERLWRRAESRKPAGSREWCECRLGVCEALVRQNKNADAAKLIAVTRLLYPQLGGAALADRFEALEKRLQTSAGGSPSNSKLDE